MNRSLVLTLWALCLCGFNSWAARSEWPRLYNQGVTAYQSNDFATAAQQFEQSLASPDRNLQQRAQYNLGNVYFRQGEAEQQQAQQLWQKAIKQYENAIAINPQDEDAKFNRDFVKKKLEKQQQEQQQQQQDQQKQDQQKQDQQKQDQQKQDQQQQQGKDKEQKDQQQDQQQQKKDEQKKDQQSGKDDKKHDEQKQQPQPQPGESDRQEKQQAKAMLDNLRENEQNWNYFPEVQMKDLKEQGEPAKDW